MGPGYVQQVKQAIVAFEVEVNSVHCVIKLRQNMDRLSPLNILWRLGIQDENYREIVGEIKKY